MQDALPAVRPTPLPLRNDTILGVCEAIGQDFGFHPNYLRVVLASLVYFNPVAVIGGYFALGLVVAVSRWIAPSGPVAAAPQLAATHQAGIEENQQDMALAA